MKPLYEVADVLAKSWQLIEDKNIHPKQLVDTNFKNA